MPSRRRDLFVELARRRLVVRNAVAPLLNYFFARPGRAMQHFRKLPLSYRRGAMAVFGEYGSLLDEGADGRFLAVVVLVARRRRPQTGGNGYEPPRNITAAWIAPPTMAPCIVTGTVTGRAASNGTLHRR